MRKLALTVGALLIACSFSVSAAKLNGSMVAKAIANAKKTDVADKNSFSIVYGGQDISRGSIELLNDGSYKQVMVS